MIKKFSETDTGEILKSADDLYAALTHLRYEGKLYRGKNLRWTNEAIKHIAFKLEKHQGFQEKVLFPYLEMHIPRYEPCIQFLRSDHKEIDTQTKKFRRLLQTLMKRKADPHLEGGPLQDVGIYLVCLLRHHVQLEEKGIHSAFKKELKQYEKKEIEEKAANWFCAEKRLERVA